MRLCNACAKPVTGGISMGGALICRECDPDIKAEIDKLRADGKPVNVMHIAKRLYRENHSTDPRVFIIKEVPDELRADLDQCAFETKDSLRAIGLKALYQYVDKWKKSKK